jgi:ABC-type uncharacterized transport system substrate-binding protein
MGLISSITLIIMIIKKDNDTKKSKTKKDNDYLKKINIYQYYEIIRSKSSKYSSKIPTILFDIKTKIE